MSSCPHSWERDSQVDVDLKFLTHLAVIKSYLFPGKNEGDTKIKFDCSVTSKPWQMSKAESNYFHGSKSTSIEQNEKRN